MKQGSPLYSKDGYRIQAFEESAGDASCVVYHVLTSTGAILRIEPAFDDARAGWNN